MKKTSTLVLLAVLVIPLIWNGVNCLHFLVEHTHAFCVTEQGHQHSPIEDCQNTGHMVIQHDQGHLPERPKFYELQQCISITSFYNSQKTLDRQFYAETNFTSISGRMTSGKVFRPPIS